MNRGQERTAETWGDTEMGATLRRGPEKTAAPWKAGFTLIELAAVVVLAAIFAGLVVVSLRDHLESVRFQSTLERIESLDRAIRRDAIGRHAYSAVLIDSKKGYLQQSTDGGGGNPARRVTLSGGVTVDGLRLRDRWARGGIMRVTVSPRGQSDTYALRLRAPNGRVTWLLFCGLSGQASKVESDGELESLLATSIARIDAG